jgi:hypothetical protein
MKLKEITYILLFFLTTLSYGFHKEHGEYSTYGNIKVLGRSAFANYNEFNKFKIIGKLSEQLCKKLNYKDSIVLEFEHNYLNYKPNLIIIEKGNTEYISKLYRIEKIDSIYSASNNNKNIGICIRQIAQKFDVVEILKLLEYVIINNENLIFEKHEVKFRNFDFIKRTKIINYHSINKKLIKSIINNPKTSELVKKIINSDVLFLEFENIKGVWNNEEFIISNEFSSVKYNDILCITKLKEGVLIFENNKNFIYFKNTKNQFQKFHINTKSNHPYYYSSFIFQEKNKKVNDGELFIYQPFNNKNGFIFSEIENKVIKKYKP